LIQGGGVIEAGTKNGRRPAVVLGGAKDYDRIGSTRGRLVAGCVDGDRYDDRRPSGGKQNDR
jgi:hypothetical protein